MSRYVEGDWESDEFWQLHMGRWDRNMRVAVTSKRGQQALRDLRAALLALPEKRLISGALCTVGMSKDIEQDKAEVAAGQRSWRWTCDLEADIARDGGEGVCAIGALLWHANVKKGMDPTAAFEELPLIYSGDGNGLDGTAREAAARTSMTMTLAWMCAYENDETFRECTPEERYEKYLAWLDTKIVDPVTTGKEA